MKYLVHLSLVLIAVSLNSCCNQHGYPAAVITVEYVGEFTTPNAYQIRTDGNDMNTILDTAIVPGTFTNDGFKIVISLSENNNNFFLMPFDSSRVDTVTSATFGRGKCDAIENLEYRWNGAYKTDRDLRVQ